MTFTLKLIPALLAATVLAAPALATETPAQRGKDLTYTCSGCHGIEKYKNAYPQYNVPKIAGQNYEYLVAALQNYKTEQRKHPTMRAQAKSFSEDDIKAIASFLSSLKGAK
jgi:cytochrome c553